MEQRPDIGAPQQTAELQLQRVRTQAAVFMIIASLAVGFIGGRASAWLLPFEPVTASNPAPSKATAANTDAAKTDDAAPKPAGDVAKRPAAEAPAEPKPVASTASTEEKPAPASEKPSAPADKASLADKADVAATGKAASATENAPSPASESVAASPPPATPKVPGASSGIAVSGSDASQRFTLLNPGSTAPGPVQPAGADRTTAVGADECERRYSSFRRSDGTYQPFGGGPRQRCPHHR